MERIRKSSLSTNDERQNSNLANHAPEDFIRLMAHMLELPQTTLGTAYIYYYRHLKFLRKNGKPVEWRSKPASLLSNNGELDHHLVATTCIHMACKSTEVSRKVRDVINVGYCLLHPEEPFLRIGDTYHRLRESLVKAELIMLRILKFHLREDLPYGYIVSIVRGMYFQNEDLKREFANSRPDLFKEENKTVAKLVMKSAWTFANDSFLSEEITMHESTRMVACASIYLALRALRLEFPLPFEKWCEIYAQNSVSAVEEMIYRFIKFLALVSEQKGSNAFDDCNVLDGSVSMTSSAIHINDSGDEKRKG